MKYKIPSWSLAFFACLLWSTAFVGVKYSIKFAPPIFVAGIRFLLAGIILIPFAGFKSYLPELRKNYKVICLVSLLQTFVVYFLFFLSLDRIKASTAAALIGLGPMVGAILGHFFVEDTNFTPKKIISFAIGIVGVTLVSLSSGKAGGLPELSEVIGIILFVLSSISGAVSNIIVLRYKGTINSTVLTSAQLALGGLMLLILSTFMYSDLTFILPVNFYLALLWLIFVSSAGFSTWYYLLATRKENIISLNIWKFVIPVTGGILGWVIMPNDSPNLLSISGMVIVAISIFIFYSRGFGNKRNNPIISE